MSWPDLPCPSECAHTCESQVTPCGLTPCGLTPVHAGLTSLFRDGRDSVAAQLKCKDDPEGFPTVLEAFAKRRNECGGVVRKVLRRHPLTRASCHGSHAHTLHVKKHRAHYAVGVRMRHEMLAQVGDAVCVDTLAKWKTNFNQLHANLLGRLDPALQVNDLPRDLP